MLRIAICDDMLETREHIASLVEQWPGKMDGMQVECFGDGDLLITAHSKNPFDIILLDVVMPLINGIDTAQELRQEDKTVKIVFLTASPEYAVDSYRVKASNYLLKPIDSERLYRCLEELKQEILEDGKAISLRSGNTIHRVQLRHIEHVEAQGKQVLVVLLEGQYIRATEPFYAFEEKLGLEEGFFKCHRSYIVNLYKIRSYSQSEITMKSGCRIPISRSGQKEFERVYFERLFGKVGE